VPCLHSAEKSDVLGHVGLPDNVFANSAAKEATLSGDFSSERTLISDVHPALLCAVFSSWQDKWTYTQNNKFRGVKPSVRL
jgi:hypothetical protein